MKRKLKLSGRKYKKAKKKNDIDFSFVMVEARKWLNNNYRLVKYRGGNL